ncbi:Hypothetical_protein [Hexamita inflata]|uniref:Hypothetical_protein n=1 Tax=Hexamita inflata TaxID=28002 RepID=A0AA86N3U9_9EUKA|nr:Hypothetical protein HINF_LOCUS117 [Hexamita inflata]
MRLSQLILFSQICYFFKATFCILFKNSSSVAKSSGPAKLFSGSNLSQLSGSTSVPLMRTSESCLLKFRHHLQIFWTSPQKLIFQCYLEVNKKLNKLQVAQMQISIFTVIELGPRSEGVLQLIE